MQIDSIDIDINKIINIAIDAGKEILKIYQQESFEQQLKLDKSPLTKADIASHNLIINQLQKITPNIPILSEESKKVSWRIRRSWHTYWLIDPLDGTKEFIKKNGEFTVNIALISGNSSVLGVVHAPVSADTWIGEKNKSAKKITQNGEQIIKVSKPKIGEIHKVVGSRSHAGDSLNQFLCSIGKYELISIGSSLKFCMVAEGEAHTYPRFGPTSEWDTAAAHAVVNSAGGEVINIATGRPLLYNAKDSLLNPFFIVQAKLENLT